MDLAVINIIQVTLNISMMNMMIGSVLFSPEQLGEGEGEGNCPAREYSGNVLHSCANPDGALSMTLNDP